MTPDADVVIAGWCEQGRSAVRAYRDRTLRVIDDRRPPDLPAEVSFTPLDDPAVTDVLRHASILLRCPPLHPRRLQGALAPIAADARPQLTSATAEFLRRRGTARVVGVTGTKGKSSTAALITHVLDQSGSALMAGNCGLSPLDALRMPAEWTVLELANFQTIDLPLAPRYVVLRPITEDHLDWHRSRHEYVDAKHQLVRAQRTGDIVIHAIEDATTAAIAATGPATPVLADTRAVGPDRRLRLGGTAVAHLSHHRHPGVHGIDNAVVAARLLTTLGVEPDQIATGLQTFPGLPHRLEYLPPIGSVRVINDSHSTAVDSTIAALRTVPGPHVLIVGGDSKDADLRPLAAAVRAHHVAACIVLGRDRDHFAAELRCACRVVEPLAADSPMDIALSTALRHASARGCVLLSPAAATDDAFPDATARGDAFRRAALAAARA